MENDRKYWLDDPRNVGRLFWLLAIVCGLLILIDLFLHRHTHFGWESLPGMYGIIGFAAFFGIVLAGKQLRKILKRDEDYYD